MPDVIRPASEEEVRDTVASALASETPIEIAGGRSKRGLGRSTEPIPTIEVSGLTGLTLYEPDELVLSAAAGTPLSEIQDRLRETGQEFAFEPPSAPPED